MIDHIFILSFLFALNLQHKKDEKEMRLNKHKKGPLQTGHFIP